MSAAGTIARLGLQEAVRRRVFLIVAVLTVAYLVLYGLGTWQAYEEVEAEGSAFRGVEPEVVAAGTPAELSRPGGVEVETAAGARVFAEAGREDAPRIVRELVSAGEEVFGVRVLTSSLEDAYLEAVGDGAR